MAQNKNIEAKINDAAHYLACPTQEEEGSERYLNNAIRKIADARTALLLEYDGLDREGVLRLSEKLSLTERLYADKREIERLIESARWEKFVKDRQREESQK